MSESFIDKKKRIHNELPNLLNNLRNELFNKFNIHNNNPDFNIIFNIFKKIYESYNTHFISNNIYNNYVLKFVEKLDKKEFDYIINLLINKELFTQIYKESESIDMYSILSSYTDIDIDTLTFLSPENEQSQYIKFPDDKDNFLNKKYCIYLFKTYYITKHEISFRKDEIILKEGEISLKKYKLIFTENNKINFFKKILSKNIWDKFVYYINKELYKKTKEIKKEINNYTKGNDEIIITDCFGQLCDYNFNKFINTISNEIIKEENKNISKTKNELNSVKNIVELFKIYYIIQQTNPIPPTP